MFKVGDRGMPLFWCLALRQLGPVRSGLKCKSHIREGFIAHLAAQEGKLASTQGPKLS